MLTSPLPRFAERLNADCALCLALVHHLYFGKYQMTFERIIRLCSFYCKKFAIIEFIPSNDPFLREAYESSGRYGSYNEAQFVSALRTAFEVVAVSPSFPAGRSLWILRKKSQS